jgi:hypothetical protein
MSAEYDYRSILAPYYEVWLGGRQLEGLENQLIRDVVYEDTSSGSDLLIITFQDPDFNIIDSPLVIKASPVKFVGGWLFDNKELFDGYIAQAEVDFPKDGVPTLTVTCMDKSYVMDRIERYEVYKDMRYDQIATKIAQRNGLSIKTQPAPFDKKPSGKDRENVTQSQKTDIQFLTDLANDIEWLCWVKGDTLYFLPPDYSAEPAKTYWWRRPPFNLLSFNPKLVHADTTDGISTGNIDPVTGKPTNDTADSGTQVDRLGEKKDKPGMKYDPYTNSWREAGEVDG